MKGCLDHSDGLTQRERPTDIGWSQTAQQMLLRMIQIEVVMRKPDYVSEPVALCLQASIHILGGIGAIGRELNCQT